MNDSPLRIARSRARAEIRATILDTAREHLAANGATGLSLRAVARDLGLVPSAVYRYFDDRDALLTAMIIAAYDSLGEAAEAASAAAARRRPRERWVRTAVEIREWALAHPHEYALLYGTPVPGYAAPQDTVTSGTRVSLALIGIVIDAVAAGRIERAAAEVGPPGPVLRRDLERLAGIVGDVPVDVLHATLLAWTQLFGLLSFELFGQTRGVVEDHAALFHDAAVTMAVRIGL
jgi:AcrR family transcriptional regulator